MSELYDEGEELIALAREIAEVEGLSPENALDRALSLMPWLAPYAAAWDAAATTSPEVSA